MDASSTGRAPFPAAIAGTEILTDNVKEIISPKKITSDEWLRIMEEHSLEKKLYHVADSLVREVFSELNRTFITPLDRVDM